MELMVEWYWVKVIRKGELVIDLDLFYKKLYELLILGCFNLKMDGLRLFCCFINNEKNFFEKEMELVIVDRGFFNEFLFLIKRKKISDNDDDIRIEYICNINKNIVMVILFEWNLLLIYKLVGEIIS